MRIAFSSLAEIGVFLLRLASVAVMLAWAGTSVAAPAHAEPPCAMGMGGAHRGMSEPAPDRPEHRHPAGMCCAPCCTVAAVAPSSTEVLTVTVTATTPTSLRLRAGGPGTVSRPTLPPPRAA